MSLSFTIFFGEPFQSFQNLEQHLRGLSLRSVDDTVFESIDGCWKLYSEAGSFYFSRLKLHVPIVIITAAKPVKIARLSAMGSWDEPRIRPRIPSTA